MRKANQSDIGRRNGGAMLSMQVGGGTRRCEGTPQHDAGAFQMPCHSDCICHCGLPSAWQPLTCPCTLPTLPRSPTSARC